MKPFLGVDITANEENRQRNGEEFLVIKSPAARLDTVIEQQRSQLEFKKEMKLPMWLQLGYSATQIASILCLGAISIVFNARLTFDQSYQRYWWLYWLTGICIGLWIVLMHQRRCRMAAAQEYLNVLAQTSGGQGGNTFSAALGVPADVQWVDLLCFSYRNQQENLLPGDRSDGLTSCFSVEHRAFADAHTLYFVNADGKFGFSRWMFSEIQVIKKPIVLPVWNKSNVPQKRILKMHHLKRDDLGRIHCPSYGILTLTNNGEKWGIYFPIYELETIQRLTGLKVKE
ncbi:MAG: hypothetical protein IJ955_02170 [Oscillospiraceae bacterium]|nr:hypothetical protein [Oscillospiraceae bacterium]